MLIDMNQYSTAAELIRGSGATWVGDEQEAMRIASYQLYEQIYWSIPQTFRLQQRGSDAKPIYIPAAKTIVETLHRYLAKDFEMVVDESYGSDTEKDLARQVWADLAARERLYSRFTTNKRYGIIRGDWLWHFYADPNRPPGSRVSVMPVDPASAAAARRLELRRLFRAKCLTLKPWTIWKIL